MIKFCKNCGYMGEPATVTRGHFSIELLLWLCFILPGLVYSIWRLSSRYAACPKCDAPGMIPVSSPFAPPAAAEVVRPPHQAAVSVGRWAGRLYAKAR